MAIDPNIILSQQPPNILSALTSGIQAGQAIRMAPILEGLQQERLQSAQLSNQGAQFNLQSAQQAQQQQQAIDRAVYGNRLAKTLKTLPMDQRSLLVQQQSDTLQQFGVNPGQLDLSDQGIDSFIAATDPLIQQDPNIALRQRDLDLEQMALEERRQERVEREKRFAAEAKRAAEKRRAVLEVEEEIKPNIKKQEQLAGDAAKLSTEIFSRIEGVEQNIANLEEGIRLIDEGAAAGPVNKWLPSLRESTVKLENLKNRLGLDVIGQVTFGALSKQELETAFDTAVPSNLKGDALKRWFQERIDNQKKLLSSLEDAGIYLAQKDSTIPGLMARRRQQRQSPGAVQGGQAVIEVDF